MCFSFRLVVKQKVAWIFFFVKFSKFYGIFLKIFLFFFSGDLDFSFLAWYLKRHQDKIIAGTEELSYGNGN